MLRFRTDLLEILRPEYTKSEGVEKRMLKSSDFGIPLYLEKNQLSTIELDLNKIS